MKRRTIIGFVGAFGLALAAGMATAQTPGDFIVGQLQAQGYEQIQLSRTWLGRTRIEARKGNQVREIIFNPRTGEILRDFWQIITPDGSASSSGGGESGQPSIVDPDDDDDGDGDEDDGDNDQNDDGKDDGGDGEY